MTFASALTIRTHGIIVIMSASLFVPCAFPFATLRLLVVRSLSKLKVYSLNPDIGHPQATETDLVGNMTHAGETKYLPP